MKVNYLANFLTILSLISGFVSIIFSLESHFTFACWAIIISVIFDGLDGQLARMNPVTSEFGRELDSLVDVVSFGIAPSILGYIFVYNHFHFWATLVLFIYLLSNIIRLAEYNITPKHNLSKCFYGLPTTVSGGLLASFILLYRKYTRLPPPFIFLWIVLCLAILMVSKVRYPNLDGLRYALNKKLRQIISVLLICVIFMPEITLFALFLIYLLFSPFVVKGLNHQPR